MANEVKIKVTGEDNFSPTADKVEGKAKGMGAGIGSAVVPIAALTAAFSLATPILLGWTQAAADDEASMLRLKASYEQATGSLAGFEEKTNAAIKAGERKGFSDDDVRDSLGALLDTGLSYEEALNRQNIAMDLARGKNISLTTATKPLLKMNEENIQTLKKYGIVLREGATEAEAAAEVQRIFAGRADDFANSSAGQAARAKIQWDELKESIGAKLLPVMDLLTKATMKFSESISKVIGFLAEHKELLPILGAAIGIIVVPALIAAAGATWGWFAAQVALNIAFAASPVGLIVLGIGLIVAAIILAIKYHKEIFEVVQTVWFAIKDAIVSAAETVINFLKDNWPLILAILIGPIGVAVYVIATYWDNIKEGVMNVWNFIKDFIAEIWGSIVSSVMDRITALQSIITGTWESIVAFVVGKVTFLRDAILYAFETIRNIVRDVMDSISNAVDRALGPIQRIIDKTKELISTTSSISLPGGIGISGTSSTFISPGRNAAGTSSWRGGLTWVGEQGAELVNLPTGSRIHSNAASQQMMGGGGGGVTVQVHVAGSIISERDITQVIRDAIQRGAFRGVIPGLAT